MYSDDKGMETLKYNEMGMEKRQVHYINRVKEFLRHEDDPIIIYGAGHIGRQLFDLLQRHDIQVKCFCVTDPVMNIQNISGCQVLSVKDAATIKDALFLLAALPPANQDMISLLRQYGVNTYLDVPKDIRYVVDEITWRPILEITSRIGCSVNCRYCPQNVLLKTYKQDNSFRVLSTEVFQACIDKTPSNMIVDFAGFAEPFLNPDIVSMMKYVAKSGRDMRLFTTLVGLTEENLEEVLRLPFQYVVLHLPDCKHFANIPLTKSYFRLLERILEARKLDGSPFVDKANGQAAPDPAVRPYLQNLTVYQNLIDWAGNISANEVRSSLEKTGQIMCDYAVHQNHNVLLPDGTVVLCCMDWEMRHVLGNLYTQSYEEIIAGSEKQLICLKMKNVEDGQDILCRKCTNAIVL